ncbi:MAG: hypothetical protein NUW01_05715 [Gemmatimonadaceae bacterium]|nr:hypothetical protein [Gemmatimonadaceae bacterium]
MSTLNLQVVGLNELRGRMAASAKTIDAEFRPAIRRAGTILKTEARSLAVGNRLPNSVQYRVLDGGMSVIVGSVAKTGLSIERGRQPGDTAPVNLITAWMKRRGIAAEVEGARVSIKTGRVLGVSTRSVKGRAIGRAQRDLAWKIALAIKARGTKALPFIFPAGHNKKTEVSRIINEALQRAVRRIAA